MADAITSRKQDRDFTKEVSELVPIAEAKAEASGSPARGIGSTADASLHQSGAVSDAIEQLLALEKQTRNVRLLNTQSP